MKLFPGLGIDAVAHVKRTESSTGKPGIREARRVAGQFEALFLNLLLQRMEKAEAGGGFFGDSPGSQVQEGLFVSMLSKSLAEKGPGLGLADRLVEDWVRHGWVEKEGKNPAKGKGYAGRKTEARHE